MIHQYKLEGYHIVLDVYSGSVHVVDEVAYFIIGLWETTPREELLQKTLAAYGHLEGVDQGEVLACFHDIQGLMDAGKLFSPDPFASVQGFDFKKTRPQLKALCIHVAHSCNLNCEYCFAAQGNYHGERALMSFEVGKRAFDYLVEQSGSHVNLEVDFFGGEPMMNWEVVKDLVLYARSIEKAHNKNFRFTFTTNGMLLDEEVMDFLNKEMHNVVLSLDGRREIHDRLRKTFTGEGSYDTVLPNFEKLVESRGGQGYYMRGTFTHHNVDFTEDIFHMADLGFRELSMEPVVCPPEDPYALTMEDLPKILEQYEILAREMLKREKEGRGFTFYHYMLDLSGGPCLHKRVAGCGSGTEYMAVTPWGDLYPCHQFVNDPDFCLGNVWEGVTKPQAQDSFKLCNVYANPDCFDCWAKLYCAGGCAANAYHATGSVNGTYAYGCELFKKRMECAVMMEVARTREPVSL